MCFLNVPKVFQCNKKWHYLQKLTAVIITRLFLECFYTVMIAKG